MMPHTAEFATLQDTARIVGVSVSTVRRWIARGLRCSQPIPGGRIVIRRDDPEQFLQNGQREDSAAMLDRCIETVLEDLQQKKTRRECDLRGGLITKERRCGH